MNLFWHGMHAPNMFLFRYAYLLSFLVITLAAWGWEKLDQENILQLVAACLMLIALFAIFWGMKGKTTIISKIVPYISHLVSWLSMR